MATSQKLTDHFLTCAVCTEVFTDPVTLQCYHTFCRKCVVSFTQTQPDAVRAKSLPCPFCSRLTKVTNHDRPVEEWANQVKPSFLIQGLIDSFGPGSKDCSNCNLCHEQGETTPAIAWCSVCDVSLCQGCLTGHRRNPASRHHNVSDLSGEVNVKRKRKVPCSEHRDEFIKFYCIGCKKTLCQTCCTLYHRKCDDVVLLESLLPEIQSTLERRKEKLGLVIHDKSALLTKTKTSYDEVQQHKTSLQSQVRSTCQRVIDQIKKKENELMNKIEKVCQEQVGHLKATIKSTEMALQIYQQETEMIDQALQSESEKDLYALYQSYVKGILESFHDEVGQLKVTEFTPSRIELKQNIDKLNKAVGELPLGEIDVLTESGLDLKATPVLQDTIDVRVTADKSQAGPVDVIVLDVNGIDTVVVTDYNNNSVKSFYNRNNQPCHSKLSLDDRPWGLTELTHNQVAVTVLDTKQILTVEVNPDLKLLSTITTQKQYWGITSLSPTTLAASSLSPPCVDVLDMLGNVLRSISLLNNGQDIINYPDFICKTRQGNILVSDGGTKSVVCLTPQGDVVFNYSPTRNRPQNNPKGITVTNTGDILVADWNLHSVLHLTESGQFVRNILTSQDGLANPRGLCVDRHGRLYVALEYDCIKVFKVVLPMGLMKECQMIVKHSHFCTYVLWDLVCRVYEYMRYD